MSAAPMLQNLRIGLRRRQSGKSKVPAKQRGSWPKECLKLIGEKQSNILLTFGFRCLPASTLQPEEREFVVDSGASMHMINKKDLGDAEIDTLTKSCSPTIVITANGEVQTHEEAKGYVKELDIFLTMKVLENTPAVSSPWKALRWNTDILMNGSMVKNHISLKNGIRIQCNTGNFVPIVVPGLSASSSSGSDSVDFQGHFQDTGVIAQHLLQARLHHRR